MLGLKSWDGLVSFVEKGLDELESIRSSILLALLNLGSRLRRSFDQIRFSQRLNCSEAVLRFCPNSHSQ